MSDIHEVSMHITVRVAEDMPPDTSPPDNLSTTGDDRFRCDIWAMCDNPYCFEHGCINAIRRRGKGEKQ